ncbi:MAG TPA: YciI family protein [Actinocrinis sp.]|nr:YciI family protein [Actinocrinis sp.]
MAAKAPGHAAAHHAHWATFVESGELIMIGPFADAQQDGSLAVFRTREGAEAFVEGDPFVLNGVVKSWRILGWNEVLAP